MPLSASDEQFLKTLFRNLEDKPLPQGDARYQPVYDDPRGDDPVDLLLKHIDWSDVSSVQMFSGFRGSGKTTELFRLRAQLEERGYRVVYADSLDYLNPAEPIDISELLIVLAGAFDDGLSQLGVTVAGESYWTRLKNYLIRTEVEVPEIGLKVEGETPGQSLAGGLKAGLDLKLALKTTPSFRQRLRTVMSGRIGELKNQVDKFLEDAVKAAQSKFGNQRIVFLLDSLEQIRGSLSNEEEVIRSVERLFTHHERMLKLPYLHVVYTVPPWLQFAMPNATQVVMIPSIRQWNNDETRSRYERGWQVLHGLLRRRFDEGGCERFFGPDPERAAGRLIALCGGHFRDLLLLVRETVLRARALPVSEEVTEAAITAVRGNFLPIAIEDAEWLQEIGRLRSAALPSARAGDVSRLTRFLDTHFVLYLTNGKEWYDTHPLIREEVAQIVQRSRRTSGQ